MITNRTDLGRHLRSLVLQHYPTIRRACIDLDIDEREIRRAWARDDNVTIETLRKYYAKLGYEVHFTVEKSVAHNQVVQATDKRDIARLGS